ncbi:hypothetical protein SAMN05421781_0019 [Marinococcus luteus]|uniref:Uncharacterized protein n=1 Tax=Marinococcus luteus TaxID=1122204 RepID=A0A1H2YAG4_9BACI|nr:hypothetical protein [Marinococcus luteus]SDX01955.1 hypothetical protein SAMN05421781_0019 [Marinococcus luteus]
MTEKEFWQIYEQYKEYTAGQLGSDVGKMMRNSDPLTTITLQTHLFVEEQMSEMLNKFMKEEITKKFSFNNKLNLLIGLDLISQNTYASINYFNEIRNDYSHHLDFKVSKKRLDKLLEKLTDSNNESYKKTVREHINNKIEFNERYRRAISLVSALINRDNLDFYNNFSEKSEAVLSYEKKKIINQLVENKFIDDTNND